jgi:N-acylglucosamine 2-epimerase (GlcNAc 2-epimerase)
LSQETTDLIRTAIDRFTHWLDNYGETSYDHQSFYAGPFGGGAKALYYRKPKLGTLVVAPIIFCEAFLPAARQLFWKKQRFPIADAHYAMGFALLALQTKNQTYYDRAVHFLNVLEVTRSSGYSHYCWGYPFDWVTRNGIMTAGTPLITTTPYVYEAFSYVYKIDGDKRWLEIMKSIADHAVNDIKDRVISDKCSTAGYNPLDTHGGVINASAYRAFLLIKAAQDFERNDYREIAERNLNFVLENQQPNGSWYYAADGVRDFVDHFHTCFVLKALTKIEALTGHEECRSAIERGIKYYEQNLFDKNGLPKPFARAPRLTVYRNELYDYAECINLGTLLKGRSPKLDQLTATTLQDLMAHWQKADGSFRSRKLLLGWDYVPMHRWAQAQLFRSLCFREYSLANYKPLI